MAVGFDAASQGDTNTTTTLSVSHTCTGDDRLLVVAVETWDDGATPAIPTVTYDSVSMTQESTLIFGLSDDERITAFSLVAPSTGADNIVVTVSPSQEEITLGACSFTGVDQTTPTGTKQTTAPDDAASTSLTVTDGATGDMVVDMWATYNPGTLTIGADQTERVANANGSGNDSLYMSTEAGASSVTMSWSSSTNEYWGHIAFNLFAATAEPSAMPFFQRMVRGM